MDRNMERNYGDEIDSLKRELVEMRRLLQAYENPKFKPVDAALPRSSQQQQGGTGGRISASRQAGSISSYQEPDISIPSRLRDNRQGDWDATITYLSIFASGGRSFTWAKNEISIGELIDATQDKMAESVLSCMGNSDRLNILLSIIQKPMTVAQLVEEGGYNSTGQVYHHIKPLIAADLIVEDENNRGVYAVQPCRLQGIMLLLAGISGILEPPDMQGGSNISE